MKKVIFSVAIVALVTSCKKVTEGGNQGVLRMEEGVERYDDHDTRYGNHAGMHQEGEGVAHAVALNPVEVDVKGTKINAFQGGLEEKITQFLNAGNYEKATDDAALKSTWFDFDMVNFKMGSTNQLLEGSDAQLKNLATILKAYPETKIKIGGYTDKTGDEATNKKISKGRAEHIRAELTKLGVGAQIVEAEGYGSEFAKVPAEASDAERAKDRRMAVRFTK